MKILGQFHTGFVVENLEKSLIFYVDILKFNIERGPLVLSGEWISDVVGEKNVKMKQAHVGIGDGHSLELIEYIFPKTTRKKTNEHVYTQAASHCAFIVDDLLGWYEYLKSKKVKIISKKKPYIRQAEYPYARYALYIEDYDGNVIELVERSQKPRGNSEN
jgi:catechol 2,3-dioxygenase-like lactoylglutathione lyase family enzyme